jgi:hypothetical protein
LAHPKWTTKTLGFFVGMFANLEKHLFRKKAIFSKSNSKEKEL